MFGKIKNTIVQVANISDKHSNNALSINSMGEAIIPVTKDNKFLGSSILNFEERGSEFIDDSNSKLPEELIFSITGNNLGNHFSLSKLMWMKKYQSRTIYEPDYLLPWASFEALMLGADPATDFSLANRILLYEMNREVQSKEIIGHTELDYIKLPNISAMGTVIGIITKHVADEFGGPIPCSDFALIGREDIGKIMVEQIGESSTILLNNHGVFTIGSSATKAVKSAVMDEDIARTSWYALQLGKPDEIPEEQVKKLYTGYKNVYGQK